MTYPPSGGTPDPYQPPHRRLRGRGAYAPARATPVPRRRHEPDLPASGQPAARRTPTAASQPYGQPLRPSAPSPYGQPRRPAASRTASRPASGQPYGQPTYRPAPYGQPAPISSPAARQPAATAPSGYRRPSRATARRSGLRAGGRHQHAGDPALVFAFVFSPAGDRARATWPRGRSGRPASRARAGHRRPLAAATSSPGSALLVCAVYVIVSIVCVGNAATRTATALPDRGAAGRLNPAGPARLSGTRPRGRCCRRRRPASGR